MKVRADAMGLFWHDAPPPPKVKKVKEKKEAPEPVWLYPDYLPHYDEAAAFEYDCYTDMELIAAAQSGELLEYDIEAYSNYTLIMFSGFSSRKLIIFEMNDTDKSSIDIQKLKWVMTNFTTVGFNSAEFDNTLSTLVISGLHCEDIKKAVNLLISERVYSGEVLKAFKINKKKLGLPQYYNHIDLFACIPRRASLKTYAGRLNIKRIQDLPFHEGAVLTPEQQIITKWYCHNDLESTHLLCKKLMPAISLRYRLGAKYGLDLRCKTNPQIAEAIFASETKRITGRQRLQKPDINKYAGTSFNYKAPAFISYRTPYLNSVLHKIQTEEFKIDYNGKVQSEIIGLQVTIANSVYTMGIGGLHSTEKSRYLISTEYKKLRDHDVTSYYPEIIINQGLYPEALGPVFLEIYKSLKQMRVSAKRLQKEIESVIDYKKYADLLAKHNDAEVGNEGGKIMINGSFGKMGERHSYLYGPSLLIQTTLTGQLSLLMLIERLELAGISVVSANTDGIVTFSETYLDDTMNAIIQQWEKETALGLEHVEYKALFNRDVNSYFAIKSDGKCKGKGYYMVGSIEINPKNPIIPIAIMDYFAKGVPVEKTIHECTDITKFITIQNVKGGAVKNGEYLGKVVRFYHSTESEGSIIYALNGNNVPLSEGCRPAMLLPDEFPNDVDKEWYIEHTYKQIALLGVDVEALR